MYNTKTAILKNNFTRIILCLFIFLTNNSCEQSTEIELDTKNKMYVYSNYGNTFYLIDYKTFEIVRKINLNVPDTVECDGIALSTNRDYLLFKVSGQYPNPPFGFAVYDIKENKINDLFFTEFKGVGYPYFISAQKKSEPGLVYVHFRDIGTYSIDLFEKKVKEFISPEHSFNLSKSIFHSPDGKWTVVHKKWSGDITGSFSELEFYTAGSGLHTLQFTLNKNDEDSIYVYDLAFTNDNKLLISYLLSNGRSRGIESYLGYYNLETKQLFRSSIRFPWSLNPYYMAYSSLREEAYLIGGSDKFYIIELKNNTIKNIVTLTGKVPGSSRILLYPDNSIAFVSCASTNTIYVIDLNSNEIIKKINLEKPYTMIIP